MLQDLYSNFSTKYGDAAKTAAENSLSKKSKSILQDSCKKYADPASMDKTQQVLGQVDAVKGQMQDNIASMLKNTEKVRFVMKMSMMNMFLPCILTNLYVLFFPGGGYGSKERTTQ